VDKGGIVVVVILTLTLSGISMNRRYEKRVLHTSLIPSNPQRPHTYRLEHPKTPARSDG
jgi:hypothetical protein